MANKFDYQNMLNRINQHKLTKTTLEATPFNLDEMAAWNAAIDVCYKIVERRRGKFEQSTDKVLHKPLVGGMLPTPVEIWNKAKELNGIDFIEWYEANVGN